MKTHPFEVHEKANRITAGAEAKEIIKLLVGADGKRGGFLVVERATGAVVLPGALQLDALIHHFDDVDAVQQLVNEVLRDQARSEEHTSELQSRGQLVCRLLLEKNNRNLLHTRR